MKFAVVAPYLLYIIHGCSGAAMMGPALFAVPNDTEVGSSSIQYCGECSYDSWPDLYCGDTYTFSVNYPLLEDRPCTCTWKFDSFCGRGSDLRASISRAYNLGSGDSIKVFSDYNKYIQVGSACTRSSYSCSSKTTYSGQLVVQFTATNNGAGASGIVSGTVTSVNYSALGVGADAGIGIVVFFLILALIIIPLSISRRRRARVLGRQNIIVQGAGNPNYQQPPPAYGYPYPPQGYPQQTPGVHQQPPPAYRQPQPAQTLNPSAL